MIRSLSTNCAAMLCLGNCRHLIKSLPTKTMRTSPSPPRAPSSTLPPPLVECNYLHSQRSEAATLTPRRLPTGHLYTIFEPILPLSSAMILLMFSPSTTSDGTISQTTWLQQPRTFLPPRTRLRQSRRLWRLNAGNYTAHRSDMLRQLLPSIPTTTTWRAYKIECFRSYARFSMRSR